MTFFFHQHPSVPHLHLHGVETAYYRSRKDDVPFDFILQQLMVEAAQLTCTACNTQAIYQYGVWANSRYYCSARCCDHKFNRTKQPGAGSASARRGRSREDTRGRSGDDRNTNDELELAQAGQECFCPQHKGGDSRLD